MDGEISKRTCGEDFEKKHFESVNMQMGRVQLDSDWNEALETLTKARSRALKDIIGKHGSLDEGFRTDNSLIIDRMDSTGDWTVSAAANIDHFDKSEGAGSLQIKGNAVLTKPFPELIKKLHSLADILLQGNGASNIQAGNPRIQLYYEFGAGVSGNIKLSLIKSAGAPVVMQVNGSSGWQVLSLQFSWSDLALFQTIRIDLTANGAVNLDRLSIDPGLVKVSANDFYIQGGNGTSAGAGRYYVNGLACVKEGFETYLTQKDYPEAKAVNLAVLPKLLYLDVWKRTITAVEDPDIREVALGGPDTCTREQLVAQVKVIDAPDCSANIGNLLGKDHTGALTAKLAPEAQQLLCDFNPEQNYTGLNNSLYRVEIHDGGTQNAARFKWSRNNGADLVQVNAFYPDNYSVLVPAADNICQGDWVELCDDVSDLVDCCDAVEKNKYGQLAKITGMQNDVNGVKVTLDVATALFKAAIRTDSGGNLNCHPKLRKWHGVELVKDFLAVEADGTPSKEIEHGIRLAFSGQQFFHADYWQFTARVNTHSIEELDSAKPMGPCHHYAPLSVVKMNGNKISFTDCRDTFLPLTKLHATKTGVDTNYCIERPGGPKDSAHPPQNVQQALDNLCGYIRHLDAASISFDGKICTISATNVQDAIDQLCQLNRKRGCATAVVGDGIHSFGEFTDIQKAIDSLPAGLGGRVCIGAGIFELEAPVKITGRENVQIGGLNNSTLIRMKGKEAAIIVNRCQNVKISDLKIKVVYPKGNTDIKKHLAGENGVITFSDSDHIAVERCILSTPALKEREQSCLTVTTSNIEKVSTDIRICENVLIPGDRQIGILVINGKDVTIGANRISRDRGFTYQGIVCGGKKSENICIENNLIRRAFQGIHVGVSHLVIPPQGVKPKRLKRKVQEFFSLPAQVDKALHVVIRGNTIAVNIPDFYQRERHGIFAGNCEDLMIKDNFITIEYAAKKIATDGIRVFGYLGAMAILRDNNIKGIAAGSYAIYFTALKPDEINKKCGAIKWLIVDNMTYCEDVKQQSPMIYIDAATKKYTQIIRNC